MGCPRQRRFLRHRQSQLGACCGQSAVAPTVALTNPPLASDSVAQGNSYTLNFTAGNVWQRYQPDYVQLWVYSGDTGKWSELPNANYLPASQGSYAWNTTGMAPGWYSFHAHATNGDLWSTLPAPAGWRSLCPRRRFPLVSKQRPKLGRRQHLQSQLEHHRPINCRFR